MGRNAKIIVVVILFLIAAEVVILSFGDNNEELKKVEILSEEFCKALYVEDSINDYPGHERILDKISPYLAEGLKQRIKDNNYEDKNYFYFSKNMMASTKINIADIVVEKKNEFYKSTIVFEYTVETPDKSTVNYRFTYLTFNEDLKIIEVEENL